jgi:hypothetical protein
MKGQQRMVAFCPLRHVPSSRRQQLVVVRNLAPPPRSSSITLPLATLRPPHLTPAVAALTTAANPVTLMWCAALCCAQTPTPRLPLPTSLLSKLI